MKKFIRAILAGFLLGAFTLGCHGSSSSAAAGGSTSSLRLIMYNGVASTALRSDKLASYGGSSATVQPQAAITNPAGTALGVTLAFDPTTSAVATIETDTGFFFRYDTNSGDVEPLPALYFTTTDCSTQAYLIAGSDGGASVPSMAARSTNGFVFTLDDGTAWMINGATAALVNISAQSQEVNGSCQPIGLSGTLFYAAVPNDPNVSHVAGPNVGGAGSLQAPAP